MTSNLIEVELGKPTDVELAKAIQCFSENKPSEPSGDDYRKAFMALVGQACSELSGGKTTENVIASLGGKGLSRECATPVVEKASEVVHSAVNASSVQSPAMTTWRTVGIVAVATVVVVIIISILKVVTTS
jgi:hypothetical protein